MDDVDLPVLPPIDPMLAKAQVKVPDDAGVWSYEPKWDGFRALVFRDGDEVVLQSRNGKELGGYFPELPGDSLSQRPHPADSRVRMLAEQPPAHFIGFDALARGAASLMGEPFRVR